MNNAKYNIDVLVVQGMGKVAASNGPQNSDQWLSQTFQVLPDMRERQNYEQNKTEAVYGSVQGQGGP